MQTVNIYEDKNKSGVEGNVSFCVDVLKGLGAANKAISSKYLYDEMGSWLFQEITKLEEYYLTRSEEEIFRKHKREIVAKISSDVVDVAELGVGDGHKSKMLLDEMMRQGKSVRYFPIDISSEALHQMEANIHDEKKLEIYGVVGEYLPGLAYARSRSTHQMVVLFLGSNIGNFFPEQRGSFLRSLRANLNTGDLVLVGFDLKKQIEKLMGAYDDARGLTSKFNLNLLERINRELGGNFNLEKFKHHAVYNPILGAMESHLISTEEQEVYIREFDKTFHFDHYEPIHIEYSFKFSKREIEAMAKACGFSSILHFEDSNGYYVDSLWEAVAPERKLH